MAKGYTLVELVIVIIVVGILAATIMPRFANRADFDQAGFHDQAASALQYARKIAVASRRYVCITGNTTGLSFQLDPRLPESVTVPPTCSVAISLPGANNSCGTNKICPPSSVTLGASSFYFDPQGRASATTTITMTGQPSIRVEQGTGYVH